MKRSEMPTLPDRERDTIATLREQLASARAVSGQLQGKLERAHKRADAWKGAARAYKAQANGALAAAMALSRQAAAAMADRGEAEVEIAQLERALSEKEAESAT